MASFHKNTMDGTGGVWPDLRPLAAPLAAGLCTPAGSLTCSWAAAPASLTRDRQSTVASSAAEHRGGAIHCPASWGGGGAEKQRTPALPAAPPHSAGPHRMGPLSPRLPEPSFRDRCLSPEGLGYSWQSEKQGRRGVGREGSRVPEPMGLLLRRYAKGTFPKGQSRSPEPGIPGCSAMVRGR